MSVEQFVAVMRACNLLTPKIQAAITAQLVDAIRKGEITQAQAEALATAAGISLD